MKPKLNRYSAKLPKKGLNKILQFGGGNFLRGFVDRLIDELNSATSFNAGVVVVKPTEKGDYLSLRAQDGLYHIWISGILNGELINKIQLVKCINEIIHPYLDWQAFLKTAENPDMRYIISNTTESGIRFTTEDTFTDSCPKEFPAKLVRWLYHRFEHFQGDETKGCTVIPCELIIDNGQVLKNCLLQYANHWNLSQRFKGWLADHNYYCNTLVDQIIPGAPKDKLDKRYDLMNYEDDLITTAEPYHLWVIDGPSFLRNELPFHKTGQKVVFTKEVDMYRSRKIRILNGAHTSMVAVGYLYGLRTVCEAMENEVISSFIEKMIYEEIIPTLDFEKGMLDSFAGEVLDRFRNPFIEHKLLTISLNSISKLTIRVLPTILWTLKRSGKLPTLSTFAFASMLWFYHRDPADLKDSEEVISFFHEAWLSLSSGRNDLSAVVRIIMAKAEFWGVDLSGEEAFTEGITMILQDILDKGYNRAVEDFVK